MDAETPKDNRVERVKERLADDLVDGDGNEVGAEQVATVVDAAAQPLADAPVQEFTPLLIEHQARDQLREQGFHRDLGDEAESADVPRDGPEERGHDDGDAAVMHLSTQQGLATPDPERPDP